MTIKEFIKKRKYLVWYVKDVTKLNNEAIVEAVLNYGNWEDVKGLIKLLGIKEVARIFKSQVERPRVNYNPMTVNYFSLYFQRHANIRIKTPENLQWKFCTCGGLR